MKLLGLSNVYSIINSVFSTFCIGVLFHFSQGGENGGAVYLNDWNILVLSNDARIPWPLQGRGWIA